MKLMRISMLAAGAAIVPGLSVAEAHLGSAYCQSAFFAGDRDDDGLISEAEATEMRAAVFGELDMNSDGSIDREEFVACTGQATERSAAMAGDMTNSEEDMMAMDANADGAVDPSEYLASAGMAYENALETAGDDLTWAEKYVYLGDDASADIDMSTWTREEFFAGAGMRYNSMDADGDRRITTEEWISQGHTMSDAAVTRLYEFYDMDANGSVDSAEFDQAMTATYGRASERAMRDGFTDASKGVPVQSWYAEAM